MLRGKLKPASLVGALVLGTASTVQGAPMVLYDTIFNTDYAFFATGGMRGNGTGQITVSGITGSVSRVIMHWHGPTNTTNPAANATVTVNGTSVTGTNIGFASDNCWGFANSQAYFADVTSIITGNGTYSLTNFLKPGVDMNGVTIEVFYDDGDGSNNRDVVLFHGNDSNIASPFDPLNWSATLPGINYSGGQASLVMGVADGQIIGNDEAVLFNGQPFLPAGNLWDGTSVPGGSPGLWDVESFNITSFLNLGLNTCTISTNGVNSDCLGLIHLAFNLPVGAAPNQPPGNGDEEVPEPAAVLLFGTAALALRRRFAGLAA